MFLQYNNKFSNINLSNLALTSILANMNIRRVASTDAQNNFGRILDHVSKNNISFVIDRRGVPEAWVLSNAQIQNILESKSIRKEIEAILNSLKENREIGESI